MVLWARVPCRLSCLTHSTPSVSQNIRLTQLSYYSHRVLTPKATKCIESSYEVTRIPAHSPANLRALHYQHVELGRDYVLEGNKDSLKYRNLSKTSQTSNHRSATTSQSSPKIQNNSVASTEDSTKPSTTHLNSKDASSCLSEELRIAMREVAYPVAVVTSGPVISDNSQQGVSKEASSIRETPLRGLLVSSFNTVTLEPEPHISFNVKLPSRTWDTITDTREFMVHIMWSTSTAQKFASSQPSIAFPMDSAIALEELSKGRTFGLKCKLVMHHEVVDHMIVVGKVLELMPQTFAPEDSHKQDPLLWKEGKWHIARPADEST